MNQPLNKDQLNKLINPKEIRSGVEFSLRKADENEMILEGYALKFNNQTLIGSPDYGFREVIVPGALDKTDMKKVPLKYNHSGSYLALASTKNDSLKLEVDPIGLKFEAKLINTQSNRDVYEMVKSGLLSECSFAFTLTNDGSEWDWSQDIPLRKIKNIDRLYDIALVDIPAYENTTVGARSFELFENEKKAVEAEKKQKHDLKLQMEMKIKLGGSI